MCETHFSFGLGCSGVANSKLVNGVILVEETLTTDRQTLHVYICNTHGKCACDGQLGGTVLSCCLLMAE